MTTPALVEVDVRVVAERFCASPRYARVSTTEQLAMAAWVLQRLEATILPASLAAAIANFIKSHDAYESLPDTPAAPWIAVGEARDAAFKTLKTLFEKEFPTDGSNDSL